MKKFKLDFLSKIPKDKLLIGLLVGVLLIVIVIPVKKDTDKSDKKVQEVKETTDNKTEPQNSDYEEAIEKKLKKILTVIQGAGKVEVMVTLRDSGESVVEKDIPTTNNTNVETSGDSSHDTKEVVKNEATIYVKNGDGTTTPYVIKKLEPKIEGILVVAEGGDDAVVKQNILDAILALFDIESHKIKIVRMNNSTGG